MAGSNFPPLVAKHLYRRYTTHLKDAGRPIIIYDPSAGYGGRCLGALSASYDRPMKYVATDPNSTNWLTPTHSRYDVVAELYHATVGQRYQTEVEVFKLGSEVIDESPKFRRYRGKIDLVFTSPPYFCAEIYAKEPTQSAYKFKTYPEWRDGFLRKTLKTCAQYLRPGGYLLWNIADISFKGQFLPARTGQHRCHERMWFGNGAKAKVAIVDRAWRIEKRDACTVDEELHDHQWR